MPFPEQHADSTKQLAGNIKYSFNHAVDYDDNDDEDGDDDDDDDDNAAVVPLSTFWAWPASRREFEFEQERAQPLLTLEPPLSRPPDLVGRGPTTCGGASPN